MKTIKAGVIGLGFIGPAHIEALRRTGLVDVVACADSRPDVAEKVAEQLNIPTFYTDHRELLRDPAIQVVHICTPNAFHFVMARDALQAGKNVICEKPLATTVAQARQLVALAARRQRQNAVNFNLRFYPLVRHVRSMVHTGALGNLYAIHGSYLQDWLFYDTDYNWRLEPALSGASRAVADIGSHWMDLIEHVTGLRIRRVMADFLTVHRKRRKPSRPVETYSGKLLKPSDYVSVPIRTEDYATVLFEFNNGAHGVLTVSQVSAGRKNRLYFELDGSKQAVAFDSEMPNRLWIGHRDRPNEILLKDPALVGPEARAIIGYPGGHNEGFPDTKKQMYSEFYARLLAGGRRAPPTYATFRDGLRELILCERIVQSSRLRRWVRV